MEAAHFLNLRSGKQQTVESFALLMMITFKMWLILRRLTIIIW